MAKKKAREVTSKNAKCCIVCNSTDVKTYGGFKLLLGLVLLANAAGFTNLNLTMWILGILLALAGLFVLTKQ